MVSAHHTVYGKEQQEDEHEGASVEQQRIVAVVQQCACQCFSVYQLGYIFHCLNCGCATSREVSATSSAPSFVSFFGRPGAFVFFLRGA